MADLVEILHGVGPTASVVLNAPSDAADAADQLALRWRNARRELGDAGVDAADLEALDTAVGGIRHDDARALFLARPSGGDTFVELLEEAVHDDLAVLDSLPRLGPVLESRQRSVPHLVVVADRTGADIVAFSSETGSEAGSQPELTEVEGTLLHIHRGHPGGWSQRRFQQRAENTWEANAGEVAEAVVDVAGRVGPRFIAVAGDVRAVTFLLGHLPSELADICDKLEGQSEDLVASETVRLVADQVARDTRAVLERFREENGQGRAADGPDATLEALSMGQAATLLVHDDPADDRRARFSSDSPWCAAGTSGSTDTAPEGDLAEGRLVDVAVRSALLGDAEIRIVPAHGGPTDQLGALLRW